MAVFDEHQNVIMGAAGQGGGYIIDQSCRFNDNDSAYLTRTFGTPTDNNRCTLSFWAKRGDLATSNTIFSARTNDSYRFDIALNAGFLQIYNFAVGANIWLRPNRLFRDPSAWYHFVVAFDTDQAIAANRVRVYVNGLEETSFGISTYPSLGTALQFNTTVVHSIGRLELSSPIGYYDGYMSEFHFVDGTQNEPTDFGETNAAGVWVPIEYTGAYGNNGFYLDFSNSSDFGSDQSGNGNDFTSSGLTSADQVTDTPTENYCVLNVLNEYGTLGSMGCSDGHLRSSPGGVNTDKGWRSTIGPTSGKWYCEATFTATASNNNGGVALTTGSGIPGETSDPTGIRYMDFGNWRQNGVTVGLLDSISVNDVVMMAFDVDAGKVWFGKNGSWYASGDPANGLNPISTTCPSPAFPASYHYTNQAITTWNFGQLGFTYTPPDGFKALSTANLPEPTIKDGSAYFQTTLYTGNGTAIGSGGNAVDQSGNRTFQPDFVWIKNRSAADNHMLYDAVRGATKDLHSNTTDAEATDTEGLSTFDSDGFTVGSNVAVNTNTENYVAWQWKANGSGSSNTDGSITSTVSANPTAGFSIATFTGNGTQGATVGHGLGVAPKMIIVKARTTAGADYGWFLYHAAVASDAETDHLILDTTAAVVDDHNSWDDTAPTSAVFSIGGSGGGGAGNFNITGDTLVAYCFAEVEGFSKFGSYTGNGSTDGPMVNCGFLPAFVMVKAVSTANSWNIVDTERDTYNPVSAQLAANGADAEASGVAMDLLSSGFKIRDTSAGFNTNTNSYIYMAFAEHPFKYANAR